MIELPPSDLREAEASRLELWERLTGDRAFIRAARILRGGPGPGHPTIDDEKALRRMAAMLALGQADNVHQAAGLVALSLELRGATLGSVQRRLSKKFRAWQKVCTQF